ncbi:MAG: LysR family transcriptional regulator [Rhizobiales bacterium]|nr:LysR family transcriptional regulator [Hyphomicrobiales bacterium]
MTRSLDAIVVFTRVADLLSFTAAARALGQPLATVSRRIAELENELGARLIQRTTRKLALTDLGRRYHEHGRRIVEELDAARTLVAGATEQPSGSLRITAPVILAQKFIGSLAADFLGLHPQVRLSLQATDRLVDLVEEGFDLAIRAGHLRDSSLVMRRLGSIAAGLYATPSTLSAIGRPVDLDNLGDMPLIDVRAPGFRPRSWSLKKTEGARIIERSVAIAPRIEVNDAEIVQALVLRHFGIGHLPTFMGEAMARDGLLVRVLPGWIADETPVSAVYPSHRGVVPALRAFLDLAAERLAGAWSDPVGDAPAA